MAWYDNGLQGTTAYPLSSGLNRPAYEWGLTTYNCPGPVIIDTISLNPNATEPYSILLNTFSNCQLYCDITGFNSWHVDYYSSMLRWGTDGRQQFCRLRLRKNSEPVGSGTYIGDQFALEYLTDYYDGGGSAPAGLEFSFYGIVYAKTGGYFYPNLAPPYGGKNSGLTQSLILIKSGENLDFYLAGMTTSVTYSSTTYVYQCPVVGRIGRLTASTLNDTTLFDPESDGYTQETGTGGSVGGGENIPDLPVSPSYPGSDMTFPSLPTGASAFGFSRMALYKPSASQLADALDILYADSTESTLETIIESCKKWWYKPDQYCIALMLSPVNATTSASKNIKFGKYDSEVSAPYVADQYHITDCGTIDVPLKYGSFLDFEPHAKIKLYLPYVGFRTMNANEIIGGQIAIKYYTDLLTGASVCMVMVKRQGSNDSILYTFDCNLCVQVPLTSMSYSTVVQNLLSAGVASVTLGAGIATGGIAGAGAIFAGASGVGQSALSAVGNSGAPDLTQSGSLSANTGVMCYPTPYICVQMPIPTTPANYTYEKGRPSNIYMAISSCRGLTVINTLHVDIPGITDAEVEMIRQSFKRGVYC